MPYHLAFRDPIYYDGWAIFELLVDFLFFIDIIVNFLSTYLTNEGDEVTDPRVIAKGYLKSWFLLDLIACVPFSLIE